MARRIEIELTSARPDGTWTWRAAGALNPRGTVDASLLYSNARAGDVVRAEAEFGIDGITVVAVEPPRSPQTSDPNRIELLDRPAAAGVTTQLAGGRSRPGPDRADDRRRQRPGSQQPGSPSRRPSPGVPSAGPHEQRANANGSRAHGPAEGDGGGGTTSEGQERAKRAERQPRPEGPGRPARTGAGPGRAAPRRPAARAAHGGEEGGGPSRRPAEAHQRRLNPGNAHRNAMLESLPVEQQPIAQQLLRGGIPAVRTALHFERERAREAGRPEPSTEGVLSLAESLVSRVKAAEWRDRAEAAIKAGDDLAMRDLRALVSGSDVARDEASRDLVVTLREMLERRIEAHRVAWAEEVTKNLDQGQVVRALRLSSRPPDASARFSAELATRLRDAASAALSPATPADQWLAVLQAVVESPVRRTVKPEGLPEGPSPELLDAARQHCGRVPALAPLLGISVPPPPGPVRPNVPVKAPSRRQMRQRRPAAPRTPPPAAEAPRPVEPGVPADITRVESPGGEVESQPEDVVPTDAQAPETGAVATPSDVTPSDVVEDRAPAPEVADADAGLAQDNLELSSSDVEFEAPQFEDAQHEHAPDKYAPDEYGPDEYGPDEYGSDEKEREPGPSEPAAEPVVAEVVVPDAAVPDAAVPDAAVPDAAVPDAAVPDAAVPDAAVPDAAVPDAAVPDTAVPDAAVPDAAVPDAAVPDAAVPEAVVPAAVATDEAGADEAVLYEAVPDDPVPDDPVPDDPVPTDPVPDDPVPTDPVATDIVADHAAADEAPLDESSAEESTPDQDASGTGITSAAGASLAGEP